MTWLTDMAPYLGLAVVLVAISSYFSGTEVALFALRRIDREQMARSGRQADALVLKLLGHPRRLISTVLVGNEAVNGTFAALTLVALGELIPETPLEVRAGIAIAITLPIVVLVGEVAAKTMALKEPMAWSRIAVRPFLLFLVVLTPVRWALQGLSEALLKPFGSSGRPRQQRDLSEEEFKTLVDAGSAQGQVDARERRIIHKVFEFGDKTVGQVMTPREKVVALSYDLPLSRLVKEIAARGYTRVPIYQRSLDNVRGVLNAKDLVRWSANAASPRTLSEILHEPLFVPRATPIKRLFRLFKQKKVHMALVVNEYGKVLGLVTMDDLLAQLFGQMRDEREGLQKAAIRKGRGGRTPVPGVPLTGPFALEDLAAIDGAAHRGEDVTPPPVDPVEAMAREAARARMGASGSHATVSEGGDAPVLADDPAGPGETPPPGEEPREVAGEGEPGAPIPVVDVVTGPSGPVAMARSRGGGDS
jgi:CBS domain containing-hemolysin-like protein